MQVQPHLRSNEFHTVYDAGGFETRSAMPGQASGGGQQVRGIIARSKGAPVEQVTVVVPDPGPGEAGVLPLDALVSERIAIGGIDTALDKMNRGDVLRSVVIMENADRAGTRA
jgi:hypothetical protein